MKITNTVTGTEPLLFHNNGRRHNPPQTAMFLRKCLDDVTSRRACKRPDFSGALAAATFRNYDGAFNRQDVFEVSAECFGLKVTALGEQFKGQKWSHWNKLTLMSEFLTITTEPLILFCDAPDVIMHQSPEILLRDFELFKAQAVFNAETNHYPKESDTKEFERSITGGAWCYLNAGIILGKRDFLTEIVEKALDRPYDKPNDQTAFKRLYREYYPAIQIDSTCHMFQTLRDDNGVEHFLRIS